MDFEDCMLDDFKDVDEGRIVSKAVDENKGGNMALPQMKPDERFSYADYMKWDDNQRWELIDGQAYCMTPAPARLHQECLGNLYLQFASYLKDKDCKVYLAPFDVRLPDSPDDSDEDTFTVVQPDLVVFCDKSKLDDRGAKGAPDLVVEILSPGTSRRDITVKFDLYQRHGVREYWILYPNERHLQLYQMGTDNRFGSPQLFGASELVPVPLFGDFVVDMELVFRD